MHIVLSGYYGFDNVGDDAILLSIVRALRKLQNDVEITVLSNNPAETRETYGVHAVNRWSIKEVRAAIKHADGVISGGGSLLQDQTGMKSIPYYAGIMQLALWLRKPVFVYSQGMGPINKQVNKWIVRKVLNKVDQITVRDEKSKSLLESIGVSGSVVVPDPVLGLDGQAFESNWQVNGDGDNDGGGESYIAVSVRDWPTENNFKEKIAKCLDELVRRGEHVVFVPMHSKQDDRTSREIAGMMHEKSSISPYDDTIEGKIATIVQSKLLIGMRLHSLIFAATGGTPFIALSYDPKIDAFASICDQPVTGHVENGDWDAETLLKQVTHMLENRSVQQEILQNKVQDMRQEAIHTAEMALAVFGK